jgi:predicted nucleic acid-binding protein
LKAVFDTNIFVSALAIRGGQAERAIALVLDVLAQKFSKGPEERQFLDETSIPDS